MSFWKSWWNGLSYSYRQKIAVCNTSHNEKASRQLSTGRRTKYSHASGGGADGGAALPGWMPAQQTPGPRAEAAPGTWTASNGSSSCGHTLRQSIWSWHTVLRHNTVREWRGHLSAGSWQRTVLLQRGLWWPPFPHAQKATCAQQTHVYCLEIAKKY